MRTTISGWVARICGIAAILFISMFALDAFEQGSLIEKLAAFGVHMIPSFILLAILLTAWKYELTGGVLFMLISLGTAPLIYRLNFDRTHSVTVGLEVLLLINLPFVIIGLLFVVSHYRLKKKVKTNKPGSIPH